LNQKPDLLDEGPQGERAGPAPAPALSGLRTRLPDLIVEAGFVFLAVFLALIAEEWREDQDRRELAERALAAVVSEIEANRDEILQGDSQNQADLEALRRALDELGRGTELPEITVNYQVALTSTAAWETARMSQAINFLEFERVADLAELYELQSLFERAQDELVDRITQVGVRLRREPDAALAEAAARMEAVMNYRRVLVDAYSAQLPPVER